MQYIGTAAIETGRLALRKLTVEDTGSCCANWASDALVYRFISDTPKTAAEMRRYLESVEEAYSAEEIYYWGIVERSSGTVIGEIFVDDISRSNEWCEVDYKIGPAFWGKGYVTEALSAVMDYLLHQAGFHRVQAKCRSDNPASERVMQKSGMRKEGILRDWYRLRDGSGFRDIVLYACVNEA